MFESPGSLGIRTGIKNHNTPHHQVNQLLLFVCLCPFTYYMQL